MSEQSPDQGLLIALWILVIAYVVFFFMYLRAEAYNNGKRGFRKATVLKLTLSSLFCVVGLIGYLCTIQTMALHSEFYYASRLLIVLGLFFCIPGDFFLQYIRKSNVRYRMGIVFFLCAQVLFLAGVSLVNLIGQWLWTILIAAIFLIAVLFLMKKQGWQLGAERGVLTLYTVFLTLVTVRAFMALAISPYGSSLLMAAGCLLFLVSDMILGIWNYYSSSRTLQNANWVFYFAGTMLIALSLNPVFDVLL